MPEKLWMEVHNTIQEAVIKSISKKKKCKNAKWFSEEDLQIAEKRSERQRRKVKKTTKPLRHDLNQILYDYTVEVKKKIQEIRSERQSA